MKQQPRHAVMVVLALIAVGCAKSEGARVKSGVDTMREEHAPDKLYERGRGFASIGDMTRAEQYLVAAIDAGGDRAKITPLLVKVCVEAKRYRAAIEYGEEFLKTNPREARLRFLIGTLYLATGDPGTARTRFEEVVKSSPNDGEAHYALGVVFRDHERDLTRADQQFREYLRLTPNGAHVEDAKASLLKSVQ